MTRFCIPANSTTDYPCCLHANPDISGIGVRTATYAQNLLSFIPAIYALYDRKITVGELQSLGVQSTTILITAFAILASAIIQNATINLTNFHAVTILSLSWMNNTNTFIYFLLYAHKQVASSLGPNAEIGNDEWRRKVTRRRWVKEVKTALLNPVLVIGCLHLSLMGAFGIWLWSDPRAFGQSPPCSLSATLSILGQQVHVGSRGLRLWSLFIYTVLLLPGFNLLLPTIIFIVPYLVYNRVTSPSPRRKVSIIPIAIGLFLLVVINIVFLVDIEIALHVNAPIQTRGESAWNFGQSLALLLLLIPIRDLIEAFLVRRKENVKSVENRTEKEGRDGINAALQAASYEGSSNMTTFLVDHGADVNHQGGPYGTALQAASSAGHLEMVKYLVENGADVNLTGGPYDTSLRAATSRGNNRIVDFLLAHGANHTATRMEADEKRI